MKDKLTKKINKKTVNPFHILLTVDSVESFYCWISDYNPILKKTYSLKKLARIYLAENPDLWYQYDLKVTNNLEAIKIAKTNLWED